MEDEVAGFVHSEPIEKYVAELAADSDLTVAAIEACTARYAEAGPLLRAALARAADGALADAKDEDLFFRALFIAGKQRDPLAFEPLLRILRRAPDEVESLLGDAVTEYLSRIVAGVFDGNADSLFGAVGDPTLDEYVRSELLDAATVLTWEGRIEREHMERFLERFEAENPVPDEDFSWFSWLTAVSLLGLRRLEPNAARVLSKEAALDFMSREEFAASLDRAEQAPRDFNRFEEADLGYVDDVVEALGSFTDADEAWDEYDDIEGDNVGEDSSPTQPVINPWRHVGRNDPCPCGSGKKSKRCCLAA